MLTHISRRARALAAIAALVPALSACEDFLRAENPGAIPEPDLTDVTYIPLMVQGTVGEFQRMFPQVIYYVGLFTDELRNHHVFFEERDIDRTSDRAAHRASRAVRLVEASEPRQFRPLPCVSPVRRPC